MSKPTILCILDGWGCAKDNSYDAIFQAKTPNWDQLQQQFPHSKISTCGLDVGLPDGQMGNSEVGHMNIGSGRIILQDLPRINQSIADKTLSQHKHLNNIVNNLSGKQNSCHIIGMLSDGGVHSHQDHIIYIANLLAKNNVNVKLHIITDGRDTSPQQAKNYLEYLFKNINDDNVEIATISGRYYAMDRDQRWDRTKKAYDAIAEAKSSSITDGVFSFIEKSYENNITDEFLLPTIIKGYKGIINGDALLFANFRADRVRQLAHSLVDNNFNDFPTNSNIAYSYKLGMIEYSEQLNMFLDTLFPSEKIMNCLSEIIAENDLSQLHLAETEKYAHVTYFFNGGKENKANKEDHILIPSPKVATYDLKPEMSAFEITERLLQAINNREYDFIVVNFANADMVGHTGNFNAAVKAVEILDNCLGKIAHNIIKKDFQMLITADHGNVEIMFDQQTNQPHTAHTMSLVPLLLVTNNQTISLMDGKLSDIAPTILELIELPKPSEMTGHSLLKFKK